MSARDRDWQTLEEAEVFWRLTECPTLAAVMLDYPAPAYDPVHVEALLRVLCFIGGIKTDNVDWGALAEAVIEWACERGYDIMPELAVNG